MRRAGKKQSSQAGFGINVRGWSLDAVFGLVHEAKHKRRREHVIC